MWKSTDQGQPEQFPQADLGLNFSLLVNSLHMKGPVYLMIQ